MRSKPQTKGINKLKGLIDDQATHLSKLKTHRAQTAAQLAHTHVVLNHVTECPSCEHAVIAHRSWKDQVIDDMTRRAPGMTAQKLWDLADEPEDAVVVEEFQKVGHMQYLSLLGCRKDRKAVKYLTDQIRKSTHNYVVEPFDMSTLDSEQTVRIGEREKYFDERNRPAAPQSVYTISTVLKQEDRVVPFMVLAMVNHANKSHKIYSFSAPYMLFVCNATVMELTYDTGVSDIVTKERISIKGEFDQASQTLLSMAAVHVWGALLDLLATPPEYIQAEYMHDGEEDLDQRQEEPVASRSRPKQQIFIRKVMPKVQTISPVDGPSEPTGITRMQHERSGHWRRLRSGRKVWVRSCIAGDPTKGSTLGVDRTVEVLGRRS